MYDILFETRERCIRKQSFSEMKKDLSYNIFKKLTNFDANEYSAFTRSKRRLFDDIRLSQSSIDTTVGAAEETTILEASNIGKFILESLMGVLRR